MAWRPRAATAWRCPCDLVRVGTSALRRACQGRPGACSSSRPSTSSLGVSSAWRSRIIDSMQLLVIRVAAQSPPRSCRLPTGARCSHGARRTRPTPSSSAPRFRHALGRDHGAHLADRFAQFGLHDLSHHNGPGGRRQRHQTEYSGLRPLPHAPCSRRVASSSLVVRYLGGSLDWSLEHLPHGRTQEEDRYLTSTNMGTPSTNNSQTIGMLNFPKGARR